MNEITTAQALAWFENRNIQMPGARVMCDKAIAALRAQMEEEKNEPLTLDELRKMVNKPVYLHHVDPLLYDGWHIIKAVTKDKITFRGCDYVYAGIDGLGVDYNLYRREPKEEVLNDQK